MQSANQLLAAIIANPDDDEHRLEMARQLSAKGNPRGLFIQVQCQLSRGDMSLQAENDLKEQEQALLSEHAWDWAEELGTNIREWVFHRGFIERIEMCTDGGNLSQVLNKTPLRHLRVMEQVGDLTDVLDVLPQLSHLTGLEFWSLYRFDNQQLAAMLQSSCLQNLKTLILHHDRNGCLADDQIIIESLYSPHRSNIEELAVNVDGTWRGPSNHVLKAIADSPCLRKLKSLCISNAGMHQATPMLDTETIDRLGASKNLQQLDILDLRHTMATKDVWNAVLKMPLLKRLHSLRLGGCIEIPTHAPYPVVGHLHKDQDWRQKFEAATPNVDWDSYHIDPVNGGVWNGITWRQRYRKLLHDMGKFVSENNWDLLEHEYSQILRRFAGPDTAQRIERFEFNAWVVKLNMILCKVWKVALDLTADTILVRVSTESHWSTEIGLYADFNLISPTIEGNPFAESRLKEPDLAESIAPFVEASKLCSVHSHEFSEIAMHGVRLFMISRTIAIVGRLVESLNIRQRTLISVSGFVYRIN